ncbi:hypothetical protein [Sulfuricaulis sp.]|uniref:hypothetical protein n=1 Tax=Sulfuricaulis sp. TaxID=2003553 RepID=UPI00355A4BCA
MSAHASAANPTVDVSKIPIAADNRRLPRAVFSCGFIDSSLVVHAHGGEHIFQNYSNLRANNFLQKKP